MKRFKRWIAAFILVVFSGAFLTGCVLFTQDVAFANNQTVATVGDDIRITRRQLNDAWDAWGWQFAQQGMSQRSAVEATLNTLINREVMVHLAASDQFFGAHGYGTLANRHGEYLEALTLDELNNALRATFNAMDRNILEIENQLRADRDMERPGASGPQAAPDHPVFTPHQPDITVRGTGNSANRQFNLNLARFAQPEMAAPFVREIPSGQSVQDVVNSVIDAYLETAFEPSFMVQDEINLMRDTRNRIGRMLRNREQGLSFPGETSSTSEEDLMYGAIRREIVRMLQEEERNQLVARFRDTFDQGIMSSGQEYFELFANRHQSQAALREWEERVATGGVMVEVCNTTDEITRTPFAPVTQPHVDILVGRVREQFISEVSTAVNRFTRGQDQIEGEGGIRHRVINNIDQVRFVPESIVNQFFSVSHILLQFTPEQRAALEQIDEDFGRGAFCEEERERRINIVRDQPFVRERVNGREVGPLLSAENVLNEIVRSVRGHDPLGAFRTQKYRFNHDGGIHGPFEYTMGIDVGLGPDGRDLNSRMVEEFTAESRRLYNWEGNPTGGRSVVDNSQMTLSNRPIGMPGAMSGLVWTDFGVHIIMYTRPVSDFIFSNSVSRLNQTYHQFLFATQTSYSVNDRTFFDTILETLTRNDFNTAERVVINTFKQGENIRVTTYRRNFRDMW